MSITTRLARLLQGTRGQGLIEYLLIGTLIAIAATLGVMNLGFSLDSIFQTTATALESSESPVSGGAGDDGGGAGAGGGNGNGNGNGGGGNGNGNGGGGNGGGRGRGGN
jgi:Flp pilus assembly pilin Flp